MQKSYFRYLNVGAAEESWGLYATTIGYSKVDPHENYPREQHPSSHKLTWNRGRILNDYYIVFISQGAGSYGSAVHSSTNIVSGSCFFLYPGIWHRYKPDPKVGWKEYWIGFNGFYAKQLVESIFSDRKNSIYHIGPDKDILVLFQKLIDTLKASIPGYPQQLAGLIIQILGHISAKGHNKTQSADRITRLIAKAQFIIQESFQDDLNMEKLAQELPMSYASFRKTFKRVTGISPNQYYLNIRLERARNLLINTLLNINEIADQTGFQSVFYFSKLFKKKHGVSPRKYRDIEDHVSYK